ncbi:MAG: nucleotide sugar dehydrogenase [Verrucomicrobiae bacterium]|nr:nucleotide sugar dehydrogenase [Verrucomicrobiae bacterium]
MSCAAEFEQKIKSKRAVIGVIGLGYAGLPLALEFAAREYHVLGFDLDARKVEAINARRSYIKHIDAGRIGDRVERGFLEATAEFARLKEADAVIICVPTPLNENREPDLSFVRNTSKTVGSNFRRGQLICLESTTYPGTTREVLLPELEKGGLKVGEDFFVCFSPEREDPNNKDFRTATIPKVVGGVTPACLRCGQLLYDQITVRTVAVRSPEVAEAAKLLENIYRGVNIALVNELKVVFDRMGVDIWEVIEAAATKPFGFHPFYPGPGLGGHCIPVDPFYLTWKAREYGVNTRFIELAGEVNLAMPEFVVQKTMDALNDRRKSLNGSRLLILGVAYKKDVDDMRESPSLHLIDLFQRKGARVDYHDPYIPELPPTRRYQFKMRSVAIDPAALAPYDAVVVATDHSCLDYEEIIQASQLVIDTHNVGQGRRLPNLVKA